MLAYGKEWKNLYCGILIIKFNLIHSAFVRWLLKLQLSQIEDKIVSLTSNFNKFYANFFLLCQIFLCESATIEYLVQTKAPNSVVIAWLDDSYIFGGFKQQLSRLSRMCESMMWGPTNLQFPFHSQIALSTPWSLRPSVEGLERKAAELLLLCPGSVLWQSQS